MFEFNKDKTETEDKKKLLTGAKTFIIIGAILVILGSLFLAPAFAVNQTAIDLIQTDLSDELDHGNTFSVFYIIILLIMLAVFMLASIVRRTEREMVFFSIGAVILAFVLTLMFVSVSSFDYITTEQTIIITELEQENATALYNVGVSQSSKSVQVLPFDESLRMSLSLLFSGIALFNGLYAIMILTQFSTKGSLGIKGRDF